MTLSYRAQRKVVDFGGSRKLRPKKNTSIYSSGSKVERVVAQVAHPKPPRKKLVFRVTPIVARGVHTWHVTPLFGVQFAIADHLLCLQTTRQLA